MGSSAESVLPSLVPSRVTSPQTSWHKGARRAGTIEPSCPRCRPRKSLLKKCAWLPAQVAWAGGVGGSSAGGGAGGSCVCCGSVRRRGRRCRRWTGRCVCRGCTAPVTVVRDGHGVPSITAQTLDDLFFAQGYVTAQDRLWQMDMMRRYAAGELAAALGTELRDGGPGAAACWGCARWHGVRWHRRRRRSGRNWMRMRAG